MMAERSGNACRHVRSRRLFQGFWRRSSMRVRVTMILPIALCLDLGGAIYVEAEEPSLATTAAAPAPALEPRNGERANPLLALPPLDSFAEVVNRPLFARTRRPARLPADAATQSPSGLALIGVILSNGESRALIAHGQPARMERAVAGQDVDGWTVEAIRFDRVVLQRGGVRADLRFSDLASSTASPGAPNATPAIVPTTAPPENPGADHEAAVQQYMDAHGGMLPAEAQ